MRGIWYNVLQGSLEGRVGKLVLQMSRWFTPSASGATFHLYWWKTAKDKQKTTLKVAINTTQENHQGCFLAKKILLKYINNKWLKCADFCLKEENKELCKLSSQCP